MAGTPATPTCSAKRSTGESVRTRQPDGARRPATIASRPDLASPAGKTAACSMRAAEGDSRRMVVFDRREQAVPRSAAALGGTRGQPPERPTPGASAGIRQASSALDVRHYLRSPGGLHRSLRSPDSSRHLSWPRLANRRHGGDGDGQIPRRQPAMPHGWPERVLAGAVAGFIVGVILAVVSGTHTHGVVGTVAGFLILLAPAAVCVALPAALYRRYRSRRAAGPRSPLGISTATDPAEA